MENVKKADARLRAATIVSSLVLIGLVWYGIKTGKKVGFFILSIFVLAPSAAWLAFAVSGPMLQSPEETKEETETETKS